MGESETFEINGTTRAIRAVIAALPTLDNEYVNPRVRALIVTKLQEAELWSLRLVEAAK